MSKPPRICLSLSARDKDVDRLTPSSSLRVFPDTSMTRISLRQKLNGKLTHLEKLLEWKPFAVLGFGTRKEYQ